MSTYYFAAFMPELEGGYSIVIPDVPNCFTDAATLAEGMEMAQDVLHAMLGEIAAQNKPLPTPSGLEAVKAKVARHLEHIGAEQTGETLYQLIQAPVLDMTPVKITVSLPKAVLEEATRKAKTVGLTRSGLLAQAVQAFNPHSHSL